MTQTTKPVGWRNDHARHVAAGKGIETGRKPTKVGTYWTNKGERDKFLYFSPKTVHHPQDEKVVEVEWADGRKETFFAIRTSYGPRVDVRNKRGRVVGFENREDYLWLAEENGPSIRINMNEVKQIRTYSPAKYFREE